MTPTPYYADDTVTVHQGDCLDVLAALPDASVDAVVTDPPYGLEFMGKEWDGADGFRRSLNPNDAERDNPFGRTSRTSPEYRTSAAKAGMSKPGIGERETAWPSHLGGLNPKCRNCHKWQRGGNPCTCDAPDFPNERLPRLHSFQVWCEAWATECLRVLKPGGHLLAFGGTRTSHRLACAIEDAGFEIRDSIAYLYGSGFPKSLNPYRSIMGTCPSNAIAPHAVRLSRFTHLPSSAEKAPIALALARTQPEDELVLLTETGAGDGSFDRTATLLSELAANMSLSTDTLWNALSAVCYGPTSMSTTATTTAPTTVSAILKCSQSLSMDTSLAASPLDGCVCPVFTVAGSSTAAFVNSKHIRVLTAPALVTAQPLRPLAAKGTSLKPAHEPVVVARKPLVGTVAGNVLAHGTGALNIDGCRVGTDEDTSRARAVVGDTSAPFGRGVAMGGNGHAAGRWPANVVLDESQAAALDTQSGELHSQDPRTRASRSKVEGVTEMGTGASVEYADIGGASRFFYTAKADAAERVRLPKPGAGEGRVTGLGGKVRECNVCGTRAINSGATELTCGHRDHNWVDNPRPEYVAHPTVKPLALMRWLVRLVTPPGGIVLEPFAGSGTTVEACILEGFRCVAIEREADYLPLILQRIHRRRDPVAAVLATGEDGGLFDLLGEAEEGEPVKPAGGRWPPNVVMDTSQAAALDQQSGEQRDGTAVQRRGGGQRIFNTGEGLVRPDEGYGGEGGASRYFPVFDEDVCDEA